MKKYLFLFVSILALIIACSKEDEPAPPPPTPKFTVSFSAGEGGSVSTTGGTYDKGTKVSVTATPDGEFVFDKWSDGNTDNPREITVSSNLSLSASFIKKKYALSVTVEGEGTVEEEIIVQGSTSSTEYNSGTTVKLTATPSEEWVFAGWSGDIESTDNPIEVSVDEAKSITATFKLKQYDLTVTVEGEGTVSETIVTQPSLYDSGTVVKLEATPSEGWEFTGWSGDIESTDNPIEVTVSEAKDITGVFDQIAYNINITVIGEGSVERIDISENSQWKKYKFIATGIDDFYPIAWSDGTNYFQGDFLELEIKQDIELSVFFISESRYKIDIFGDGSISYKNILFEENQNGLKTITSLEIDVNEDSIQNFKGWGGLTDKMGGVETNKSNTITIDLKQRGYRIKTYFSDKQGVSKIDYETIEVPQSVDIEVFFNTITNPNTVTYYQNNSGEYILFMPSSSNISLPNSNRSNVNPGYGIIFKKINGYWKYHKLEEELIGWGFRNFKQFGNEFIVVGDGNEIGPNPQDWQGDLYFGKINGDVSEWIRVNDDSSMMYYHGTSGGDLNNDGLIDVGGTGSSGFNIFLQTSNGDFSLQENIIEWSEEISDAIGGTPFAWEFADVTGDERNEIIMADYGQGNPLLNEKLNNISVWKYDENQEQFLLHFISQEPTSLFNYGRGATKVSSTDLNNDGILDLIIAGEDQLRSMETWIGNGDGTFKAKWSQTFDNSDFGFAEFFILDVNQDGLPDIVLNGLDKNLSNKTPSDGPDVGILFNSSILINKGDGSFSEYSGDLLQDDFGRIAFGIPYIQDGKLHFFGSYNPAHLIDYEKREILIVQQDISFDLK